MVVEENGGEKSEEKIKTEFIYSCLTLNSKSPILTSKIGNEYVKCLLDTGSTLNLIQPRYININKIKRTKHIMLRTATGKCMKILGEIKFPIYIGEERIIVDFVVVPDITIGCILGTPFLIKEKVVIEVKNNVWTVRFSKNKTKKPLGTHKILTTNNTPVCSTLYRIGPKYEERAADIINKYLQEGIIRKSTSPWRIPIALVKKKEGDFRLCVDYRQLNAVTIKDTYPMPRTDEFFDQLASSKYFTKLDAESGYHQIDMAEEEIKKTAFGCREGLFEFVKMPFGLVNGPATLQRVMNEVLAEYIRKFVVIYMDDILIYSNTEEEHRRHLESVLRRLNEVGLKLNEKNVRISKIRLKF
jgi:hypothetical protein